MSARLKVDPKCPKAEHAYATQDIAERMLLQVKIARGLRPGGRSRENRTYKCLKCPNAWHLTSKGK